MKALRHLNKYFWKYRNRYALGIVFIILTNIFTVYSPQIIKEGVNFLESSFAEKENVLSGEDALVTMPDSLKWLSSVFQDETSQDVVLQSSSFVATIIGIALLLGLLYIVVYIIKGIFLFATRQTIIVNSRLVEFDLKNEIFDYYQRLDMAFYKRNKTGDLMNRISEDVSKVRMYLGPAVMYTLNLLVMIVMVIGTMVWVDWELTLWALMPLPLMSVAIYFVSNVINRKSEKVQRQQSQLSTIVQESVSGIRVLKAYTREQNQMDHFKDECDLYKKRTLDLIKTEALFMPIIVLLVGLSTIISIYVGGLKVIAGELLIGDIFMFVFYVNMLTWPFASVGWVTSLVQKAEASQQRINEFLKTEPAIENHNIEATEVRGEIEFRNVGFTYPDSGVEALKNVSFKVPPGKTLAVIGHTGSGKSTLAHLISRMYDASAGTVLIDGLPIKEMNLSDLRRSIGYVPQDVFLFSESIGTNIAFGLDSIDEERIQQASKDSDIHENIIEFANGYDTVLGERGINLSGGQKQRVSIARAIIKNPSILVFDDCLSAVDTETEEKILQSLKRIMKDKTSLIISHRVSSIKHADHILVLEDGNIAEQGSHDDLLKREGPYSRLYQKQLLEEQAA